MLDRIEELHRTSSVLAELNALRAVGVAHWDGVADLQIANRLLAIFSRLVGGQNTEQFSTTVELLEELPKECFTTMLLEQAEMMLQRALEAGDRTVAGNPTEQSQVVLLRLLNSKWAQKTGMALEPPPSPGRAVSSTGEVYITNPTEPEPIYGSVVSTVQDYLMCNQLRPRVEACKFVRSAFNARSNAVFPKVIAQQVMTRLLSEVDYEIRCALTVAITLCFEPSPMLSAVVELLDSKSYDARLVAVVCLHNTISDQRLLPKEESNPFRTLDGM